ncbi:hypothetical protein J437_LFUL011267, partial [Ladona fulva]
MKSIDIFITRFSRVRPPLEVRTESKEDAVLGCDSVPGHHHRHCGRGATGDCILNGQLALHRREEVEDSGVRAPRWSGHAEEFDRLKVHLLHQDQGTFPHLLPQREANQ